VETFLDACHYIGSHAHLKHGLVLTAPLDGARVQWNPIERALLTVPIGNHHLELRACGVLAKSGKREKFVPRWWRVNRDELSNRVAPCLIHMMDAYFSALVLEYLAGRGVWRSTRPTAAGARSGLSSGCCSARARSSP
jgi:hypothetical protein